MSIRNESLTAFTEQLASMVEAGITLARALLALEKQELNKEFRQIIHAVRVDVESGLSFSAALKKHPQIFSLFYVNMIYAGEEGAGLSLVMKRVAEHLEKEEVLRTKVQGIFAYPLVLGILSFLIVVFLVVVIVPVFAKVYSQLKLSLPWPTRLLLGLSNFLRKLWWLILGILVGLGLFYRYLRGRADGRQFLDRLIMKLPVLGRIIHGLSVARFVRSFGDMLSSGIPIFDSLAVTDKIVGNQQISRAVADIKTSIKGGGTLVEGMARSDLFPPVVIQMTYAGEESGALGEMFDRCADILDRGIELATKRTVALLEPALIMVLAFVVGFIALSIYLPMFDLVRMVS